MVVGGYSPNRTMLNPKTGKCIIGQQRGCEVIGWSQGLTNDVELLSLYEKDKGCSGFVNPIRGRIRKFNDKGVEPKIYENEGEVYGLTGVLSKDAPIVCGGKNGFGATSDLNTCWEWEAQTNK